MQPLQSGHPAEWCVSECCPLTGACEAHPSKAVAPINAFWMGPALTSKWVQKQNCVRFTLLFWAALCWAHKATMLKEQWWQYILMAKHKPRVKWVTYTLARDCELNSAHETVVTHTSEFLFSAFKLCSRKVILFCQGCWAALCSL